MEEPVADPRRNPAARREHERRQEIAALGRLTVKDLRAKHIEVFGEATRSGNKDWLRKRIAWRIQANASGDTAQAAPIVTRRPC